MTEDAALEDEERKTLLAALAREADALRPNCTAMLLVWWVR